MIYELRSGAGIQISGADARRDKLHATPPKMMCSSGLTGYEILRY